MTKLKEFILTDMEDDFMVQNSGLGVRRQGLYPSEASVQFQLDGKTVTRGKCLRACFYRAMKEKMTNPGGARLMATASLGKWDEQGLIERWKEMGIWIDNNIKFFDQDFFVSGELDAVLSHPDKKDYRIGYEIKTHYGNFSNKHVKGAKGRKLKDGGYSKTQPRLVGAPKWEQFLQAVYYSHFYVTTKGLLDEYRMYYLERGDGTRNEFRVGTELVDGKHKCWYQQIPGKHWITFEPEKVYMPYAIEDVQDRYKALLKALRDKTMPGMDFRNIYDEEYVEWAYKNKEISKSKYEAFGKGDNSGSWQCSYCGYKDRCAKDEG